MKPHTQRLPQTLAKVNAALARRHVRGLSVEVIDVKPQALHDASLGHFMRFRFVLDDGDVFHVDSDEMSDSLEARDILLRATDSH